MSQWTNMAIQPVSNMFILTLHSGTGEITTRVIGFTVRFMWGPNFICHRIYRLLHWLLLDQRFILWHQVVASTKNPCLRIFKFLDIFLCTVIPLNKLRFLYQKRWQILTVYTCSSVSSPSSRDAGLLLRLLICELAHAWEKEEQLWDFLLCLFKIVFWSPHQHFLVL